MRALSPLALKKMRAYINATNDPAGMEGLGVWLEGEIQRALGTKRGVKAARKAARSKKAERKGEWDAIKAVVLRRADGRCESCGNLQVDTLNCDHMFGGHGRRLTLQSPATVWALCFFCDRAKTMNRPSALHWLQRFQQHAIHIEQPEAARIAEARIDSLSAQGRVSPSLEEKQT